MWYEDWVRWVVICGFLRIFVLLRTLSYCYTYVYHRFQLVDFGLAHLELQTKEDRGELAPFTCWF